MGRFPPRVFHRRRTSRLFRRYPGRYRNTRYSSRLLGRRVRRATRAFRYRHVGRRSLRVVHPSRPLGGYPRGRYVTLTYRLDTNYTHNPADFDLGNTDNLWVFGLNRIRDPYWALGGTGCYGYSRMYERWHFAIPVSCTVYASWQIVRPTLTVPYNQNYVICVWPQRASDQPNVEFTPGMTNYADMERLPGFRKITLYQNDASTRRASYRGRFKMREWIVGGKLSHLDDQLEANADPKEGRDPLISFGIANPGYMIDLGQNQILINHRYFIKYRVFVYQAEPDEHL